MVPHLLQPGGKVQLPHEGVGKYAALHAGHGPAARIPAQGQESGGEPGACQGKKVYVVLLRLGVRDGETGGEGAVFDGLQAVGKGDRDGLRALLPQKAIPEGPRPHGFQRGGQRQLRDRRKAGQVRGHGGAEGIPGEGGAPDGSQSLRQKDALQVKGPVEGIFRNGLQPGTGGEVQDREAGTQEGLGADAREGRRPGEIKGGELLVVPEGPRADGSQAALLRQEDALQGVAGVEGLIPDGGEGRRTGEVHRRQGVAVQKRPGRDGLQVFMEGYRGEEIAVLKLTLPQGAEAVGEGDGAEPMDRRAAVVPAAEAGLLDPLLEGDGEGLGLHVGEYLVIQALDVIDRAAPVQAAGIGELVLKGVGVHEDHRPLRGAAEPVIPAAAEHLLTAPRLDEGLP